MIGEDNKEIHFLNHEWAFYACVTYNLSFQIMPDPKYAHVRYTLRLDCGGPPFYDDALPTERTVSDGA